MRKFIFSRMIIVLPKEVFKTCHGQRKKRFMYYALRFMKIAFKMALEDPKKIMLKSTKNIKLSGFFSDFRGLNYPSYQLRLSSQACCGEGRRRKSPLDGAANL